jgi:PAS domain S-box-containing protein
MMKSTKEKEEAVNQLRSDLEVKKQKLEEDKSMQEFRSDLETVTSSLTSSTTSDNNDSNKKKRKMNNSEDSSRKKKQCTNNQSVESSNEDSSGGEGSCVPNASRSSFDKSLSSVSDITGSDRGSSPNNSGSGSGSDDAGNDQVSRLSTDEGEEEEPSSDSISSDVAVASRVSSPDQHRVGPNHMDVIFNNHKRSERKRPPQEISSLERSFQLDYEEVFDKANVPQLIAATSGKIVTWNECFIKATGLRRSEVERMTIFSLVKPDKLSNFFEIVAQALKPEMDQEDSENNESNNGGFAVNEEQHPISDEESENKSSSKEGGSTRERPCNYTAMTLPCIDFPAMKKRRNLDEGSHRSDPLHVTVSVVNRNHNCSQRNRY